MSKDNGQAGEKELRIDFEAATRKNILMMVAHGNDTRKMIRELQEEVVFLKNHITMQQGQIDQLRNLIVQGLQIKVAGGSAPKDKK